MAKTTKSRKLADEVSDLYATNNGKYVIPINLDFDGTVVKHCYPKIGDDLEHCVDTLKKWISKYNVGIILHTMRSDELLDEAVDWFKSKGIKLWGIQMNPSQKKWTNSPKSYGWYIDDMSVGIPLKLDEGDDRPHVDWIKLDKLFTPFLEQFSTED